MSLTFSQKQYIQKHIHTSSPEEIAQHLHVSEKEIVTYTQHHSHLLQPKKTEEKAHSFFSLSFKQWLQQNWPSLLILLIFVLICYVNALNNGLVSDDVEGIQGQAKTFETWDYFVIRQPSMFVRNALWFTSYHIGGLQPIYFRMWNIFFHIGVVWLIYIILHYFTTKKYLPFLVASIFAVHPLMIESVTWISGGLYSLSSFFLLLSFLLYLKGPQNKRLYIFSILSYICALASSEKVIIYPLIILLYEFSQSKLFKHWKTLIPYFITTFCWLLLLIPRIVPRVQYLSKGSQNSFGFYNPLLQIPVSVTNYFILMFWPEKLTLYHSEFSLNWSQYIFCFIGFLTYVSLIFVAYKKNKSIFFWLTFFFITLIPTLNPFGLSWLVAERYAYLGSIGIFYAVCYLLYKLIESKKWEGLGYFIFVLILMALMTRTIFRNIDWKNEDNLWVATGKYSPSDPKTHNNLGDMYGRQGNFQMAALEFSEAVRLNPKYAEAYHNLANAYASLGRPNDALATYQKSISLNPNLWQTYHNMGIIYYQNGRYADAESYMKKSIELSPGTSSLYYDLGVIYIIENKKAEAKQAFLKALELDPQNQYARTGLIEVDQ